MFYYLFTFFLIILTSIRYRKNLFFIVLNIGVFIYYILIPISWKVFKINSYFPIQIIKGISNFKNFEIVGIYILLFYFSLILGYITQKDKDFKNSLINIKTVNEKHLNLIAFLFFLISLISILIYVLNFGNIVTAIPKIIKLRWNNNVKVPFAFLRIFNSFIISSFYCYYSLKKEKNKIIYNFFFIITFLISLYYLILNSGRSHFIFFFAPIFYIKFLKVKMKNKIFILIFFLSFILILILYGDSLRKIFYISEKIKIIDNISFNEKYSKFIVQLSHPYMNLLCIKEHVLNYRYGKDLINFINLVPKINLESLWMINTEKFMSSNGIPVDFISYGYYQFGILGIIVFSFILGKFVKAINDIFLTKREIIFLILKVRFIIIIFGLMSNFDIEVLLRGNIHFILLYLYLNKIRKVKK